MQGNKRESGTVERPTYHIKFSPGSELEVLVVLVRGNLALELIELAQLHLFHEEMELPWEKNIC